MWYEIILLEMTRHCEFIAFSTMSDIFVNRIHFLDMYYIFVCLCLCISFLPNPEENTDRGAVNQSD